MSDNFCPERERIMPSTVTTGAGPRLALWAETAADVMTTNLVSIRENATVQQAVALLIDKGYHAAPVIDEAGRPVGVLSVSDLLAHDREKQADLSDVTLARDLMTPAVFAVPPDASAGKVVADMLGLNVHRLFVVDGTGTLIGVITALDILRHLRP
jgi:CBS domain-containing protein